MAPGLNRAKFIRRYRSMLLRRETRVSGTRLGNLGITVAEFFNSETFEFFQLLNSINLNEIYCR